MIWCNRSIVHTLPNGNRLGMHVRYRLSNQSNLLYILVPHFDLAVQHPSTLFEIHLHMILYIHPILQMVPKHN